MTQDSFFVEVSHRPRRVAFLVDVDQSSDRLFDEIVDFNSCCWGGRFNPVIPVVSGEIPEPYWRLLDLIDPDIFYLYCDIEVRTAERIHTQLRPLTALKPRQYRGRDQDDFRVEIDEQATVLPLLKQIPHVYPIYMRTPEPAVLIFDYNDAGRLSSFIRRNFGGTEQFHIWCRDNSVPILKSSSNDAEVMKALAANRNLVMPLSLSAEAPQTLRASTNEHGIALTVCYGSSPWNFVEYWNEVHFQDHAFGIRSSLKEIWLSPTLLEDRVFYENFLELLRRRVFKSQHNSRLRLVSYDESAERMREVTTKICTDLKWNMHPSEPIVRKKGELPNFEIRRVSQLFGHGTTARFQHESLTGQSPFLQLNPPAEAPRDRDERWIAEIAIENPGQEKYFANKVPWWKLPKKNDISTLFVRHVASRVDNTHRISAEVSARQKGVILNIPNPGSLFSALLLSERDPEWMRTFRPSPGARPLTLDVVMSDKGRYTQGVLGLFESLQKAAYVFEHPFWSGVVHSLSTPSASDQTRNRIRKQLSGAGAEGIKSEDDLEMLVNEVLDAALHIQRPHSYATFDWFLDRYKRYLTTLSEDEQALEVTQMVAQPEKSEENWIQKAARNNLRRMLSEMTIRKLFMQGVELQCCRCLASLWYHIDELKSVVTCRGCRQEVQLPAEIRWSYFLNELVSSAVRDQGVAPVIRTINRLFHETRECFCFLPGLEIRDYSVGSGAQLCEVDLVWIRDGEFGIAEVTRTPKKFSASQNFKNLIDRVLPDRLLLVGTSGTTSEMQALRSTVQSQISPKVTVESWNNDVFANPIRSGWNTVAYSLFP